MELVWLEDELGIEKRKTPHYLSFFVKIRKVSTLKKIEGFINTRTNFLVGVDPKDFRGLYNHIIANPFTYADVHFVYTRGKNFQSQSVERVWCSYPPNPDELSIEFEENERRFSSKKMYEGLVGIGGKFSL